MSSSKRWRIPIARNRSSAWPRAGAALLVAFFSMTALGQETRTAPGVETEPLPAPGAPPAAAPESAMPQIPADEQAAPEAPNQEAPNPEPNPGTLPEQAAPAEVPQEAPPSEMPSQELPGQEAPVVIPPEQPTAAPPEAAPAPAPAQTPAQVLGQAPATPSEAPAVQAPAPGSPAPGAENPAEPNQPLPGAPDIPIDTGPWEQDTVAVLQGLDKVTARVSTFDAPLDKAAHFGTLEIIPHACFKRPPEEPPENAAFLEIREIKPGETPVTIFTGWMFSTSPALSSLEHPVYDIWVVDCKNDSNASAPSSR